MSWVNLDEARRRLVLSLSVISLAAACLWFGADLNTAKAAVKNTKTVVAAPAVSPSAVFPGTGVGPIPDRGAVGCGSPVGAPLDISFNVTGITGPISNVSLSMTATHTWVGDLDVNLRGPGGTPDFVVFASTGSTAPTGCGSASDLGGTYVFNNTGTADWWSLASPFPAGTYRTTVAGDQTAPPAGNATDLTAAFAGVANPNGTWTLRITDGGGGDTGAVSAASLTIDGAAAPRAKHVDHDGDGKTDYMIARQAPGALGENAVEAPFSRAGSHRERLALEKENPTPDSLGTAGINWWTSRSSDAGVSTRTHGIALTDFITPADFDGDLKSDLAVWRTGAVGTAAFHVLRTTDNTVQTDVFGQTNDVSAVVGDYDGDGKADSAVFRCPSTAGQCVFYFRGTNANPSGNITFVPFGFGTPGTIFANAGDFDGDGKNDFCIQRNNPNVPGQGQFVLLRSSDSGVEFVSWGLNTDFIIPGDYDADGKSDFAVGRNQSGQRTWYILTRTGTVTYGIPFGLSSDFLTPGDYDGDGKTDISVWRPSDGYFYILQSSNAMLRTFKWGTNGDYPPANFRVQ